MAAPDHRSQLAHPRNAHVSTAAGLEKDAPAGKLAPTMIRCAQDAGSRFESFALG